MRKRTSLVGRAPEREMLAGLAIAALAFWLLGWWVTITVAVVSLLVLGAIAGD